MNKNYVKKMIMGLVKLKQSLFL